MLNDKDIQDIKQALTDVAPYVEEPILYREYVDTTPGNQVMGVAAVDNFTDVNMTAEVTELDLSEINTSGGAYVQGDVKFSVRVTREPSYKDRLVWNNQSFKPKSIKHFFLGEIISCDIKAGKE